MKDFVSSPWISVFGLVASMSVVYVGLAHYGYPGTGLVGVGLALSAAAFVAMRPTRSISQIISDVEAEPRLAVVVPERIAPPTGGAQPGLKG